MLYDATLAEEQRSVASIVFAFSVRSGLPGEEGGGEGAKGSRVFDMVTMKMVGKLSQAQVAAAVSSARVAAATTFAFLKAALERGG